MISSGLSLDLVSYSSAFFFLYRVNGRGAVTDPLISALEKREALCLGFSSILLCYSHLSVGKNFSHSPEGSTFCE